jgi:hypothetical protein
MIVRILGEGQLTVDDSVATELNKLDAALEAAVNARDEAAFRSALSALLDHVRSAGTPVPPDSLEESDVILPYAGASMADVRGLLSEKAASPAESDEGLIPG